MTSFLLFYRMGIHRTHTVRE